MLHLLLTFSAVFQCIAADGTNMDLGRTIHNPLARAMYYNAVNEQHECDHKLWYQLNLTALPPALAARFLQCEEDAETQEFLRVSREKSDWIFTQIYHTVAKATLIWFMTSTSINGMLHRGGMFVFSQAQFRSLLTLQDDHKLESLLDIGAGDGGVTQRMAPYFRSVYVTEMSPTMRWRLQKKYSVLDVENWDTSGRQYDVISCLNVLDRCEHPMNLLRRMRSALKPDGTLVIALVLPWRPHVEVTDRRPRETLQVEGAQVEQQVASVAQVFADAGFRLVTFTRLPYLCEGDLNEAYYMLSDYVFVLKAA